MKRITVPKTEEEQAREISRHIFMREVAFEALIYHYNKFHATDGDNDEERKNRFSNTMAYWQEEYRELTEGEE